MSSIPSSSKPPTRRVIYCSSLLAHTGERVVGKKIVYPDLFFQLACQEMTDHDGELPSAATHDEWSLPLSPNALPYVSSGVGRAAGHAAEDYIVREYDGYMLPCLRRAHALPAQVVWVKIVPTRTYNQRYRPRLPKDQRLDTETLDLATHVIVDFIVVVSPPEAHAACLNPYEIAKKIASGTICINSTYGRAKSFLEAAKAFALVAD